MEIGEVLGRTLFKGVSGMNHRHIYDWGLLRLLSTKRLASFSSIPENSIIPLRYEIRRKKKTGLE